MFWFHWHGTAAPNLNAIFGLCLDNKQTVMSVAPAPSSSREFILQPNYFTSSIYVKALRHDISILILKYHETYSQSASSTPFSLFKSLWLSQGWNWLHFKVFDDRSRQTFLEITLRLFLGEICYILCCPWPNKRILSVRKNGKNRGSIHQGRRPVWTLHFFLHSDKECGASSLLDKSHTHSCRYVKFLLISVIPESQIQFRSLHHP